MKPCKSQSYMPELEPSAYEKIKDKIKAERDAKFKEYMKKISFHNA